MSSEIVVLRKYGDEMSARLDAAVLEANGIPAQERSSAATGDHCSRERHVRQPRRSGAAVGSARYHR